MEQEFMSRMEGAMEGEFPSWNMFCENSLCLSHYHVKRLTG